MSSSSRIDRLAYLGQGYFHPDYDLEADEPFGVVAKFRRLEAEGTTAQLRSELREILAAGHSEDELARLWIDVADSYYDPRNDGISLQSWFENMLAAIS
ncbi:contact-dependent growth inhibition system immunity protein [Agromyces sp. MMS24-K17]|uniref:contact-dependent growth inhibition system immunity protein n=1 Tax=Agromyces sp. MMS24-K17 TaxID=3372850 RepID=UPI00375512F8